jgi:hypothetical protein
MRIGMGGLTIWSFLVATAHGAGLMVVPVWMRLSESGAPARQLLHEHANHAQLAGDLAVGLTATAVHGVSYLLVTAAIAWIVFTKIGVGLLRKTWINLDLIWAAALIVTGGVTVALFA